MTEIKGADDWKWYVKKMDADYKIEFSHNGEPEKYPCLVESEERTSFGFNAEMYHRFIYRKEKTCSECGHKSSEWDVKICAD